MSKFWEAHDRRQSKVIPPAVPVPEVPDIEPDRPRALETVLFLGLCLLALVLLYAVVITFNL